MRGKQFTAENFSSRFGGMSISKLALGSRGLLVVLALVSFLGSQAYAQIDTGRITGTIRDKSGALVPDAEVTLTNVETGVASSVPSTSAGVYTFEAVKPGTYSVKVRKTGFSTFASSGIVVHVQNALTIDVRLSVGRVDQQVTVTSDVPLLQSEDASLGQTINKKLVDELPLANRDWTTLSQLAAGVSTKGDSRSNLFTANGVNYHQNDFRLNGINNKIEV